MGATSFNSDISQWNTSKVTRLENTFYNATSFNSDISQWDVSSVTNMNSVFRFASALDMCNKNSIYDSWDVQNTLMDQSYSSWANLTSEIDACGVCEGDNSTCTDDCGVVNGDGSTCLQKSQDDDNFPDYGIALVVIGGVAALAGV